MTETLDTALYGYPLVEGYSIDTDFALLRAEMESGWNRQRRNYLHNASLVTLSWRLTAAKAKALNDFLQGLDASAFFNCDLLSGNDSAKPIIHPHEVRRTGTVRTTRVENTDNFIVSFEAETRSFGNYSAWAVAAAGIAAGDYPANLPLPLQRGFTSEHSARNATVYSLTYQMNSETLARWLAFAGYAGTGWFKHPMVSANVPCGYEYVRYIGNAQQRLVGPDRWEVTVTAECRLRNAILDNFLPSGGDCVYDQSDLSYDEATEEYDCGGTPAPPTGGFIVPSGAATVSASSTGTGTQTAEAKITFFASGLVSASPSISPAWTKWHDSVSTLADPGVAVDAVCEFSVDGGTTWLYYTPTLGGPYISLRGQDVSFRSMVSNNISESKVLPLTFSFQSGTVSPATTATADVTLSASITVTVPGQGIVEDFVLSDTFIGAMAEGVPASDLYLSVTVYPDGTAFGIYTGATGPWYAPATAGVGNGKWLVVNKVSGDIDLNIEGVRIDMSAPFELYIFQPNRGLSSSNFASYYGTVSIYDAAVGGTLIGSGSLELVGELTP